MTEERKYAILFTATLLCARKLAETPDQPTPAKICLVDRAIADAVFILNLIDKKSPTEPA
jgi:hypothetical protein